MRVTIQDIAQRLNLSHTTVSRVLNQKADRFISEATRQRVIETAAEMGYRANRLARTLARRRSEMIGVIMASVEDPLFAALTAYLNRRARELGYRILFEVTEPDARDRSRLLAVEQLLDWRVDGLLIWWNEGYGPDLLRAVSGTPTVFLGAASPAESADSVLTDTYAATRLLTEHLLKLGHRHLCYLGSRSSDVGPNDRAIHHRLEEAGLPPPIMRQIASDSPEDARTQAYEFFRSPRAATALLCQSDTLALGAMRGLRDAGLSIPRDISVTGFGNDWAAEYVEPSLTTVALPYRGMVDCALQFLINRMGGDQEEGEPQRVLLTSRLVPRGSTAPPPSA